MSRRFCLQLLPAYLSLAIAAGVARWLGGCALAEDTVPAQGQAAAAAGNEGGGVAARPTGEVNVKVYEKAFLYPAADQLHLRAAIQMRIADSFMQEKAYADAEQAYAKALEIGPGGWHKGHCEENLQKARNLAAGEQP